MMKYFRVDFERGGFRHYKALSLLTLAKWLDDDGYLQNDIKCISHLVKVPYGREALNIRTREWEV